VMSESVVLTNLDFDVILPKITNKSFKVLRYYSIPITKLAEYNIILYYYPGYVGHWVLLAVDEIDKNLYFFDPYGYAPDTEWPRLRGWEKYEQPHYLLTKKFKEYIGYHLDFNHYNIQGEFVKECLKKPCEYISENECGELVIYRLMYKDLDDHQFYMKCMETGPVKIFKTVKAIENM
jgi:hypothetical protein